MMMMTRMTMIMRYNDDELIMVQRTLWPRPFNGCKYPSQTFLLLLEILQVRKAVVANQAFIRKIVTERGVFHNPHINYRVIQVPPFVLRSACIRLSLFSACVFSLFVTCCIVRNISTSSMPQSPRSLSSSSGAAMDDQRGASEQSPQHASPVRA